MDGERDVIGGEVEVDAIGIGMGGGGGDVDVDPAGCANRGAVLDALALGIGVVAPPVLPVVLPLPLPFPPLGDRNGSFEC
jgi:hypothetical protein